MKTKLSPLLTAFDALDLALRVAGVIGGLAAIASHLPSLRAGPERTPTAAMYVAEAGAFRVQATQARVEAAMARAQANAARTRVIRVHVDGLPTPPAAPVIVTSSGAD